jgi:type IV pilus biogenesis protein CpaD/CtpE
VVLAVAVSACENRNAVPLGRDFGNATQHNMSQQIVNPEPAYAGYGAPDLEGERAAGALSRYKGGAVTKVEAEATN